MESCLVIFLLCLIRDSRVDDMIKVQASNVTLLSSNVWLDLSSKQGKSCPSVLSHKLQNTAQNAFSLQSGPWKQTAQVFLSGTDTSCALMCACLRACPGQLFL